VTGYLPPPSGTSAPVKVRGQDYEYGYGLKCRVGLLKLELVLEFSVRVRVVGYDLGSGLLLRLDVLVKTVRCRRRLGFTVKLELGFGRGRCRDGTFRRGRHMGEDIPWGGANV